MNTMNPISRLITAALTGLCLVHALAAAPQFVSGPSGRYSHSMAIENLAKKSVKELNALGEKGDIYAKFTQIAEAKATLSRSARSPHEETCHRPQPTASGCPCRADCELHLLRYGLRTCVP